MGEEEVKSKTVSWSDGQQFANDFGASFKASREFLKKCRYDKKQLVLAVDEMHEMYRMLIPYCSNEPIKKKLVEKHDSILSAINVFFTKSESFKEKNFAMLFEEADSFFSDLVDAGVKKNFFPKPNVPRSNKEVTDSLRQT